MTDCDINEFKEKFCAPPVQDLSIEKVIPHQQYSPKFLTNDIALLRVAPIKTLGKDTVILITVFLFFYVLRKQSSNLFAIS